MKRVLALLLASWLLVVPLSACGEREGPLPSAEPSAPIADDSNALRVSEGDIPKLEQNNKPMDLLIEAGLLTNFDFMNFDRTIILSEELFDPKGIPSFNYESYFVFENAEELGKNILEAAKNPGLGIRALHEQGITGEGVNVAIIDQNLLMDHPEYAGRVAAYYDSGCEMPENRGSMHAPAVLSILAGETVGVAPGAKVWFAASPSWNADAAYDADCLEWIIEQNKALPEGEKIRLVSVSAAPGERNNSEQWVQAVEAAKEEGILVLDCSPDAETGFIGPAFGDPADPENVTKCQTGWPGENFGYIGESRKKRLFAPCSYRTTAQEYAPGLYIYTYWGKGGLSWSIPYASGVLALGWQVNPDLDAQTMKDLLFRSAWVNAEGNHIIDPTAFIDLVKETIN